MAPFFYPYISLVWIVVEHYKETHYNVQMTDNPETIIRSYVNLPRASSKGWCNVKCLLCHDYRARGAFRFEQESVGYNCFNCGHSALFNPTEHTRISERMQKVFDAFGIPASEFKEKMFDTFVLQAAGKKADAEIPRIKINFNDLELPKFFRPLDTEGEGDIYDEIACEYLLARGIDPKAYPFLMADKKLSPILKYLDWKGRVIIPYYRHGKVVFYQGRDLLETDRTKYLSPKDSRDAVFYGFDEIYAHSHRPLYIQEGFFDAFMLKDSVATFSNKLTEQQIEILNRCHRPKVVIPDREGKGYVIANQAIEQGWSVSFPDIGSSCKDMNDAILKYGRLYVLKSIVDNTSSGFAAQMMVNMYCKE